MVDQFWSVIFAIKGQVIATGFNACHTPLRQIAGDQRAEALPRDFVGYDLSWLTARSSWKFTARNCSVSLGNTLGFFCASQVRELPNVLWIDYQAALLRSMPPSEISRLPSHGLKDLLLSVEATSTETRAVLKEEQNIWRLQKLLHTQVGGAVHGGEKVDMTAEMKYAIQDTVALWETEQRRGSLFEMTAGIVECTGWTLSAS